jgi:phospholipid/cholesterol/gamma-HCH transport system substrate-binding protein
MSWWRGRYRGWAALAIAVAVAAAVGLAAWAPHSPTHRLAAHFTRAVGVFAGSDVRILGVKVGEVVAVTPEGTSVRIDMRYDARYPIPAGAQAVIVPPSVVSDRYVQLTPGYTGGPKLADGADLPVSRTAVPLEIDDIYHALDAFNRALGPDGANSAGALSGLVATGRANLDGNGDNLHAALDGLSRAVSTLANGREDLFGSVDNLQRFTTMLAQSDQQVREFNQRLAEVADQLAGEGDELAAALAGLATALSEITTFVRDNRDELKSNVAALADITGVLVREQDAIRDVLDVAPLVLSNLNLSYNPRSGTLDTRDNAMGPYDPASYVCSVIVDALPLQQVPTECTALARTLNAKHLPLTDQLRKLLGLPPGVPGAPAAPALPGVPGIPGDAGQSRDPTLGGILGVPR